MLTFLPILAVLIFSSGAVSAALLATGKQERQQSADESWRLIVLRNGVRSEIPFASLKSQINAPGMVQVFPQTQPRTLAASIAPVPTACPLETAPTKARKPVESLSDAKKLSPKITSTKETKFKWGYPQGGFEATDITPAALDAIARLIGDGERRKTVLSWAVFGSNGGTIYSTARPTIQKALENAE